MRDGAGPGCRGREAGMMCVVLVAAERQGAASVQRGKGRWLLRRRRIGSGRLYQLEGRVGCGWAAGGKTTKDSAQTPALG